MSSTNINQSTSYGIMYRTSILNEGWCGDDVWLIKVKYSSSSNRSGSISWLMREVFHEVLSTPPLITSGAQLITWVVNMISIVVLTH